MVNRKTTRKNTKKNINKKNKNSCKKSYQKFINKMEKLGKLHVKYGSKKIKLNIGCPEIKKKRKNKIILPPSIYNI